MKKELECPYCDKKAIAWEYQSVIFSEINSIIDSGKMTREEIYAMISAATGQDFNEVEPDLETWSKIIKIDFLKNK